MQYSDTSSSRNGLIQDCEDLLSLGATGISSDTTKLGMFTRYINAWYQKVTTMILESQDDWDFDDLNKTDYPVATTPLIAAQRDYTFPSSLKILKVKRVDVTYDGTNYYKATPWDSAMTDYGLGNDTNTDSRFSKTQPYYDLKGNSIWLYPLPIAADVTAGGKIRIEFYREITEFLTSDTTAKPGFDTPFHRILSIGAALDYALIRDLTVKDSLTALLQDYEARLKRYYGAKDNDIHMVITSQFIDYE